MSIELSDKKILVTGGAGFLGSFVVNRLLDKGVSKENIRVPRSRDCDLRAWKNCEKAVSGIDVVIHLAARVGGIGYNLEKPAELVYDNALMGILLMEASKREGVEKFVSVGTVCSYPKYAKVPFREEELWDGYPEETNAPYGIAKKLMLVQTQAYRLQYGFNAVHLIPVNLYGPGDNFDPETSHVIPGLIVKICGAKKNDESSITAWGSGEATREFLYVEDAARAIIMATELYDKGDPVNIGSGHEISIHDLAHMIKDIVGYEGEIQWDTSRPDGQPKRWLDTTRAKREFGFSAEMSLIDGLTNTIDWYQT